MDSKYTGLIMAAHTVVDDPGYPTIIVVLLWALLLLVGYLLFSLIVPWISETVCDLFNRTVSWGELVGFQ